MVKMEDLPIGIVDIYTNLQIIEIMSARYIHRGPSKFISLQDTINVHRILKGKDVPYIGAASYLQSIKDGTA